MALSPTLVWEIRSTGSAGNGGAFRAGATGTDYSQQDAAQVVFTDLTVDASGNTNITSIANPFAAAHVGNIINISSVTGGWTAGYYEITSVSGSIATLDRSPAAVGTTGGAGKLGGAADSPVTLQSVVVNSNVVWMKAGTYPPMSFYFLANNSSPTATAPLTRFSGYGTTRGDSGRAAITSDNGDKCVRTGGGWYITNLSVDGTSGGNYGIYTNGGGGVYNCKVSNFSVNGITVGGASSTVFGCELNGMRNATSVGIAANRADVIGCYVHDSNGIGISVTVGGDANGNIVANCTQDGIQLTGAAGAIGNSVSGCGRHGLNQNSAEGYSRPILNNIFASNGGYGAVFGSAAGNRATVLTDGNAYYNNTSGARSNGDDTTVNPQNASGPHVNTRDLILTSSPFVNSAAGDFRLNNNSGAGAACRAAAIPSTRPGSSVVGYADMGAAQHQEPAGTAIAGGGGRIIGSSVIQPARQLA